VVEVVLESYRTTLVGNLDEPAAHPKVRQINHSQSLWEATADGAMELAAAPF
jgi:hypothetical protein